MVTASALKESIPIKKDVRKAVRYFSIEHANINNLKDVSIDIPSGVLNVVTGVAGSGKSTLITQVFAKKYEKETIIINQKPLFATNRFTPSIFLGF